MEKMKVTEKFERVMEIILASDCADKEEMAEFIAQRKEMHDKKATRETKAQRENRELAEKVYDEIVEKIDGEFTIADFLKVTEVLAGVSSSKATAIIKILVADGKVVADTSKKRRTYAVVTEDEAE